jgi:hypothetical protein
MSGFLFTKAQRYYNIFGDKGIKGAINARKLQLEKDVAPKRSKELREYP